MRPPSSSPSPDPPSPPDPAPEARPKRLRRPLAVAGLAFVLLASCCLAVIYVTSERLGDNVTRVKAFDGLDEAARPPATGALTFLLVGTDSRSEATPIGVTTDGSSSEADVVMVARIAPDMKSATVVSIPRDSLVDIPDHGRGRVAGAYATGGPTLLIATVEKLTDLRVDHFAVIDFVGFRSMVDTLGGIDVEPYASANPTHVNGDQALLYVRDRTGLERGERAWRQQTALRAILDKAATSNTLSDPVRLYDFLDAASRSVGVDDTLSNGGLRVLALKLSDLRSADVLFLRAPVASIDRDPAGILVRLDPSRAPQLWAAVQHGAAQGYLQQNERDALGPVTR